jgi:hypothetical protein
MSIAISQDKHCFVKGVAHIVECVWVCRWVVLQEDARDCCEVKVGFRVRLRGRGWDSHFAGGCREMRLRMSRLQVGALGFRLQLE